ncbi:MAG: lactonase family protein [Anaerolineales bacterium]
MAKDMLVYVGTRTVGESEGIYVYSLDGDTGALEPVTEFTGIDNPTYLTPHPQDNYLYAINEVADFGEGEAGGVTAFALDPETGTLTLINQQSSEGPGPCYISVDQTGRFALVANYAGGSVTILPIEKDGRLAPASDFVQHFGSSVNPQRQAGPHAHSIQPDPTNRYAFAADLGLDKLMIYKLDLATGKLEPNDQPWAELAPGAGPRHFAFHPNGEYVYVITELANTIVAFSYDEDRGVLDEIQTVSALPKDFDETSYCADIHILPSGKFLYGSNRGHDSIVIFSIDEETGKLAYVDHESTQGETPRNFCIDPSGNFLLAANQDTDNIVTFRIDQDTGKLTPTGHQAIVSMPVCLKVLVP